MFIIAVIQLSAKKNFVFHDELIFSGWRATEKAEFINQFNCKFIFKK